MFDNETFEHEGAQFRVTFPFDDSSDAPWEREDGHGTVSDWRSNPYGETRKVPGERPLCSDHGSARFYDFAGAVRIARRDGWGVSPYRMDTEKGANGLMRVTGQWFKGARLSTFASDWHDDINAAIRQVYAAHRATMTPRAYAALAAEADFQRLADWCNDRWQYVGVVVELLDDEGESLGETESVWGIESDSSDYLEEPAHERAGEILARVASAARGVHSAAAVTDARV